MSRAVLRQMEGQAKPPDAEFIWISTIPDAVLALAETKQRQLKKWAKRGSGGRPGIPSNKGVYEMLNDSVAVDLVWLCERLPRHILDTLVDERVPAEAAKLSVRRTSEHGGGRWVAYLTHAVRLLANLAQLGSEFSELSQALNHGGRGSPALLVDSLLLAQSVALATRFPNPDGEDAWTDTEGNDDGAGDEAATPGEGAAAAGEEEAGEEGAGCGPLDLLAQAYRALASLLRGDHREIGGAKSESLLGPVGQALVAHSKVREAVAEGLMDGMAAFFFEMERDCDRQRRKEMVWAVASAVDILVFCTWDKGFVAELVVSEQMRNGASLSVLKKFL
ncbi:hypothetical protein T484DRAFT_1859343 [Baffinella frigidus]|nr:hypothetical protein T484DRAFT_1859343 [Cryptophyta sp. CCMP2293]